MRYFTYDVLLDDFYSQLPLLKKRLAEIYEKLQSSTIGLERWGKLLLDMAKLHGEAVQCQNVELIENFHDEAMEYIRERAKSRAEWRAAMEASAEHLATLQTMSKRYQEKRKCHAPDGAHYICFCNEK